MTRSQKAAPVAAVVLSTLLLMAGLAGGAQHARAQDEARTGTGVAGAGWNQYLASEIIGLPVRDENNDEIGEVGDLVTRNGEAVTGLVVRLTEAADGRDVLVSYPGVVIGAFNRTYDGRGAGQAGAARDPRSFGARDQDETAFADPRSTYGRIQPSHILLPRLSADELARAPDWPMGAWNGRPPSDREEIAPDHRQITFSAIRGVPARDGNGRMVGVAEDLLVDRAGDVDALIVDASMDRRPVAIPIEAVGFDETLRLPGGALTRPHEIEITGLTAAEANRSRSFRID